MASIDISTPCDSLLAVEAGGALSGRYTILAYQSAFDCTNVPGGASFEQLIKETYREVGGELAIGLILQPEAARSCTDYGREGSFCIDGMRVGFAIASDGCLALLLITA